MILTVLTFRTAEAAEAALAPLDVLVASSAVEIADAAVVTWPEGQRKPTATALGDLSGGRLLWGGTWGVLLALIFVVPIAGPTFGAAAGAFAGALAEFGLDDRWVKHVRDVVTPGTSALFLLHDGRATAHLTTARAGDVIDTIELPLTTEYERRLRTALAEEQPAH